MESGQRVYYYRLDAYWRSVAIYAIVLLLYGIARSMIAGTLWNDGKIEVVIDDPLFWLLLLFVVGSAAALLVNLVLRRRIIVAPDHIVFATRLWQRRIERSDIRRVIIRREHAGWRRLRSIRLYRHGKRFPIRIRPSFYERERELTELLLSLRSAQQGRLGMA